MNKTISMLIRWLYLVIGCALLAAAGVRLVGQWKMADTVKEYLTPEAFAPAATSYNADGEYAGLPLEATDFAGFTPLFFSAQTLVFQEGIVREYSLPCDITYYSWDGSDLIPALVLDKGTDVLFFPTEAEGAPLIPAGYGVNSFPGTESGWRYAVPFLAADQPLISGQVLLSQQDWDYYHVRLSDLQAVCSGYWKELEWDSSRQSRRRMGISVRELSTLELLRTDGVLYRAGIYNSPDLSVPLWDKMDSLLTAAGAALILLFVVHPGRGKPRRNH